MRLTKRFLVFYLVCVDRRGISATQLSFQLEVTYKTAMLKGIRVAMGQRDSKYKLSGIMEFDDAYFDGPTIGENGAAVQGRPRFLWPYLWMDMESRAI